MNELPEEIELPPMDYGLAAHEQCDVREAQLKSSLAANREQKAEIERLKAGFEVQRRGRIRRDVQIFDLTHRAEKAEAELASLRASVGEKWIETKELLQAFTESERNHLKYCRDNVYYAGLGPQDDRCDLCKKADLLLAPPTLPGEGVRR